MGSMDLAPLAGSANVNTPKATVAAFATLEEEAVITGTGGYLRGARDESTLCSFPLGAAPGDGGSPIVPGSEPSRLPRFD